MAEKNNAICSICGKEYYMCTSCRDSIALSPWKLHTDTAEHYKVYQVLHGYSTGVYSKDEAKTKLQNIDLSDLNTFRPHIKFTIKEILKEEKSATKANVEDATAKVEVKAETKVETEKMKSTYKKSQKVEL